MTVPPVSTGGFGSVRDSGSIGGENELLNENLRRKYRLLQQRCDLLHTDNQKLLNRVYKVKKLTKRYKKEIKFLISRLDMHGDNFRLIISEDVKPTSSFHQYSEYIPNKAQNNSVKSKMNDRSNVTKKSAPKRKNVKNEKVNKFVVSSENKRKF